MKKNSGADEEEDKQKLRRPRGRPPGSKNKAKAPVVITSDSQNALRSHVLEVCSGSDIVQTLTAYCRRKGMGLSVLSARGCVSQLTLRQASPLSLNGRFDILSLSGTVLPPTAAVLSVFISAGQGQVLGGTLAGPLVAAGPVLVMAASFANAVSETLEDHRNAAQQPPTTTASQCSGVTTPLVEGGNYPYCLDIFGCQPVSIRHPPSF